MTMQRVWLRRKDAATIKALYGAAGVFAKVHAVQTSNEFGVARWRFTGSHCDADGKAITLDGASKIHVTPHVIAIASDTATDMAADMAAAFELVAERVRLAVANESFDPMEALGGA